MKAALCKTYGPPESLVLEDIAEPQPGPGEVCIDVRACGINYPDVLMMAGKYQVRPPLPFSPGVEVAGVVAALGDGVDGVAVGQRVLGLPGHGGLAEKVCVAQRQLAPLPDGIDFTTAAAFVLTYGTSYHALVQRAGLQPGETLLVLGAAGGVGLAAVELGRNLGARVIAAASTPDKLELAREYGAVETVNYTEESLKDAVKRLTDGRGADVIYDPVGGDLFDDCMRSVAWRGRVLVVGFAAGDIPKVPTNLALLKGASIVGVFWGRHVELEPDVHAANMQALVGDLLAGKLKPHVSRTFALDEAGAALNTLATRQARGKVVVTIGAD